MRSTQNYQHEEHTQMWPQVSWVHRSMPLQQTLKFLSMLMWNRMYCNHMKQKERSTSLPVLKTKKCPIYFEFSFYLFFWAKSNHNGQQDLLEVHTVTNCYPWPTVIGYFDNMTTAECALTMHKWCKRPVDRGSWPCAHRKPWTTER